MSEVKIPIPAMIYNKAVGGHVTSSQQIIDENLNKEQSDINQETIGSVIYDSSNPNGMGRIVLKKTDNFKEVIESQTNGNTIFVIKYDFVLTGNVTVPSNCILDFEGGSVNGDNSILNADTIIGNNTTVYVKGSYSYFNVKTQGTFSFQPDGGEYKRIESSVKFRICGHRGFPNSPTRPSPDNSIIAIEEAAKHGFSGIETDPRKDKDGVIVLLHNDTVDSVSTTTGQISQLSYKDVFYKDIYGNSSEVHLTTLSEAVLACKAYNMFILFDNKQVLTIDELITFMEEHEYYNFGIFNYSEEQLATIPDQYIRIIEPKATVADLETTLAKFPTKKNIWMRVYTLNDNIPTDVINRCKEYNIKIITNGTLGNSTNKEYIVDAADSFITDTPLVTLGQYQEKNCSLLKSDAGLVATADNSGTYNSAVWSVRNAGSKLISGYHWSKCQSTKFPDTASVFGGGSFCLTINPTADRILNIHMSGAMDSTRIVIEKFFQGLSWRTAAEVMTNENVVNFVNTLIIGENIDCNTITTPGSYLIFTSRGCTNMPFGRDGYLKVEVNTENDKVFVKKTFVVGWSFSNGVAYGTMWNENSTVWLYNGTATLGTTALPNPAAGSVVYEAVDNKPYWYNGTNWVNSDGIVKGTLHSGTFANKPTVSANSIPVGFKYFCTDKQTAEGATNGIEIIHKGSDVWVDALGRVVS